MQFNETDKVELITHVNTWIEDYMRTDTTVGEKYTKILELERYLGYVLISHYVKMLTTEEYEKS